MQLVDVQAELQATDLQNGFDVGACLMGPITTLFCNPAMKILEERLWAGARKRYLEEHPADRKKKNRTITRKARTEYKDKIATSLKEADQQVRTKWGQFKKGMTEELKAALTTLLRMSDLDWYSVEVGSPASPDAIAVPYELIKHVTESLLYQHLRKGIDFENLNDETLQALSAYAADQKFRDVLDDARRHYEPFKIGQSARFVISEIIRGDSYFLGDEKHHSRIDTIILSSLGANPMTEDKKNHKDAAKRWFDAYRKTRNNDRRFTGDGWEITPEEFKSWVCGS
jgi:hypothetical protein